MWTGDIYENSGGGLHYRAYLIGKGVAGSIFCGFSPVDSDFPFEPKLNQPLKYMKYICFYQFLPI